MEHILEYSENDWWIAICGLLLLIILFRYGKEIPSDHFLSYLFIPLTILGIMMVVPIVDSLFILWGMAFGTIILMMFIVFIGSMFVELYKKKKNGHK